MSNDGGSRNNIVRLLNADCDIFSALETDDRDDAHQSSEGKQLLSFLGFYCVAWWRYGSALDS